MVATLFAALQLGACGDARPTGCGGSGGRPHPEIGGELPYTCYAWRAVRGGLYLLDVATRSLRPLMSDRAWNVDGAWSPDGGRIAFQSTRDGRIDLYLMDVSGGRVRRLTNGAGFNESPRWSPDGSWISFTSSRAGVKGPYGAAGVHRSVYLVRPDGTDLRRLMILSGFDGNATWSPDGSRFALVSDRGGAFDLYIVTPDGRDQRQLTQDGRPGPRRLSELVARRLRARLQCLQPAGGLRRRLDLHDAGPWSRGDPSHSRLRLLGRLVTRWLLDRLPGQAARAQQLFVVRPDGSDLTQLTTDAGDKGLARWRPG